MITKENIEGAELLAENLLLRIKEPEGLEFQDRIRSIMFHYFADIIALELDDLRTKWEIEVGEEARKRGE